MATAWGQHRPEADSAIVQQASEAPAAGKQQDWLEGAFVRVETQAGEVIENGQVYTFDEASNVLVLRLPNTSNVTNPSVFNYRVIKQRFIKNIAYLSGMKGAPIPPVSYVNLAAVKSREKTAMREADKALARIGQDVTARAQQIFDAFAKTLDPSWRGKNIFCPTLNVTLKPPYDVKSLQGESKAKMVVQRVLEGELAKMGK